jgi:hypothetical protein
VTPVVVRVFSREGSKVASHPGYCLGRAELKVFSVHNIAIVVSLIALTFGSLALVYFLAAKDAANLANACDRVKATDC